MIYNHSSYKHNLIKLTHIKNGEAIKKFINQESEKQRLKKRTLHTMDIDADAVDLDD